LDGARHASRIAVYGSKRDVIVAWLTYQQERLAAGLPALPYVMEPRRLAGIADWDTVPARRSTLSLTVVKRP
jgi:hypothetical protein